MKAFAEYFEEDGLLYRRNTLLQFGDSWDLIGSVVLANPGSAEPMTAASNDILALVSAFYEKYRVGDNFQSKNWHEFSPDSTMRFVEKIFNGWYIGQNITLNGVIQLFNTFNIKNQNLKEAVAQIGVESDLLFSYNVYKYFNDKPTYFGFSDVVLGNDVLRNVAMNIFSKSSDVVRSIYNSEFSKNSFYHPKYINHAYGQSHFQKYKNDVLATIVKNA
ncbi:hypothetical protein [Desulfobacula sp.]|uniref:hypothetical protein n=1 Tax=Desulfobacula sp. TaxID=2593537 RepID=UPI00261C49DE|nr:hypothetical protein [Desulfobacula sp.]